MDLLLASLGGIAVIVASLVVGCLAALLFRALGRGMHHPTWGLALALLLIPLAAAVPAAGVLRMTIVFTLIFVALLWAMAGGSKTA